jgi:hypothetical protein
VTLPKLIFRAVAGAVKNAADAHPKWSITLIMARSIAKRATGTLTAQLPEVLAARARALSSDGAASWLTGSGATPVHSHLSGRGGASTPRRTWRSPPNVLRKLHKRLGHATGQAKYAGDMARAATMIEVLRVISEMEKRRD